LRLEPIRRRCFALFRWWNDVSSLVIVGTFCRAWQLAMDFSVCCVIHSMDFLENSSLC